MYTSRKKISFKILNLVFCLVFLLGNLVPASVFAQNPFGDSSNTTNNNDRSRGYTSAPSGYGGTIDSGGTVRSYWFTPAGGGVPSGGTINAGGGTNSGGNVDSGGSIGTAGSGNVCNFSGTPTTFAEFLCIFINFINTALPVIVAAALLVFFWGLVVFIRSSGDVNAINNGKQLMIWGVVGLFVMLSFVGILNLVYSDFFGGSVGIPQLPENP